MIEIRIPKEINRYEAKFIGPFTLRQSVALLIALPSCILLYNIFNNILPGITGFVCIVPASLAFLFGWCKPYGMNFEKFAQGVFISSFLAPSKRKYCTENYYAILGEKILSDEECQANSKGKTLKRKKKHRRSSDAIK